jgi:hypothetical protein
MKPAFITETATCLAAATFGASAAHGASALSQAVAPAPQLLRTQTAFDILVHLPYEQAAPLFGPDGERPWAGKHWNPQFLYPQPAHDEQGAVFTVQHGPVTAIWVNTLFDLDARHFIYAYFIPGIMVTTLDLRFTAVLRIPKPLSGSTLDVVRYRTGVDTNSSSRSAAAAAPPYCRIDSATRLAA